MTKATKKSTKWTSPQLPEKPAIVFDGKAYAAEREKLLIDRVKKLKKLGVNPRFADIVTTDDKASLFYINLKKKAAERVGIEMEEYMVAPSRSHNYQFLMNLIGSLGRDPLMHGVMLQMPLLEKLMPYQAKILNVIPLEKDVDGLREESPFLAATAKAVIAIIEVAEKSVLLRKPPPVFIAGSEGTVGSVLMKELKKRGYDVKGFDKKKKAWWDTKWGLPPFKSNKADVLVSVTGKAGLIKPENVAKGAAVIDVGAPFGEVEFDEVKPKTSFITPVPGGVGPVTVVSLLENVVDAAYNSLTTHSEGKLS